MNGWAWYLLVLFIIGVLISVATSSRKPAGVTFFSLILNGLGIVATLSLAGVL